MPNKHILLGISGGIAAYKSCELVRLLRKQGHTVSVAMSRAAAGFVSPQTFQIYRTVIIMIFFQS